RFMKELMDNNIRIAMIGEMDAFPEDTRNVLLRAIEKTKNNTGMILCFAMNYGGQRELVLACKELCQQVLDGTMTQQDIDNMSAQTVQNHLFTSQWPNVDLMIRTSGEMRLSNFLLWQLAYAELYFTDVAWPDFNEEELQKAFDEYARRDRRFGGV
ncbi:MAG: di-trans,poly-cis-decaprenylcistransferase, partial [Erysipelotrichaceae bacterium]|nr:di-trans,poly-cis-decaprenylcistransferase [Erysipelotrichaceae bacterium]